MGQLELRRRRSAGATSSLRETTFVVVDLETTGGRASGDGPRRDHRDRRGQGARRRGARRTRHARRPGPEHPAADRRAHRHHLGDGVRRARRSTRCCPRSWSSPAARCWSPTTPASTSGSCAPPPSAARSPWPRPPVLCTVRLARRVLTRDEAPSVRLSALARLFGAATTPTHRALDDARATVDVLHALIERVGNQGVHTYTDLRSYLPDVTPAQRRKRHLADGAAAPARRLPVPRARRRGALRRHRGRPAQAGRPVLQRRRPAHPDQGDGVAGHRGRPRRVRARPRGGRARAAAARRARAAVQPPVEVPAPLVVGGADRRGVSAVLGRAGTASSDTRRSGRSGRAPTPSRPPRCWPGSPGVRTCTTRLGRSALHGPPVPSASCRRVPAPRGITADRVRRGARGAPSS